MSSGRRSATNGNKLGGNIPGWHEHVAPFRKDSLFWHSIWLSAGRPQSGELYRIMVTCRNRYHYAIRKAKNNSKILSATKLIEASERGDSELLKEMKNIKGSKNKEQSMPESLEGKATEDEILKTFKDVYEELYNSSESVDAMRVIKLKRKEAIKEDSMHEVKKNNWENS